MAFKMLLFAHLRCAVLRLFRLFSHCAPNDGYKLNDGILYGSMDGMHLLYFTFHRQIKVKVFTIYILYATPIADDMNTQKNVRHSFLSHSFTRRRIVFGCSSHWKHFVQMIVCRTIVYRSGAYLIRKNLAI